jgi:hypothetical protein
MTSATVHIEFDQDRAAELAGLRRADKRKVVLVGGGGHRLAAGLYFKGADDKLMPTRKDQPPPDLRYFKQAGR